MARALRRAQNRRLLSDAALTQPSHESTHEQATPGRIRRVRPSSRRGRSCLDGTARRGGRQGQDRAAEHLVGRRLGPRHRHPRRLRAGGIKQLGGKLGGQPVEFVQADMAGSPDQAKQLVDRMIQRDKIDLLRPDRLQHRARRRPDAVRGQGALPVGQRRPEPVRRRAVQRRTSSAPPTRTTSSTRPPASSRRTAASRRSVLIAPNYPAGKDALGGFKRQFKGAGGRRALHQARPDRLRRRARADPRGQARLDLLLPARRDGHQLHQAVRRRGPVEGHHAGRPAASRPTRT